MEDSLSILHAIILGIVEGITEYLPISSTGHLIITSSLLGLDKPPQVKAAVDAFNIVVQGGAILAVVGLYWQRIVAMCRGLLGRDAPGRRLMINLIIAFMPAAVLGVLLDEIIEKALFYPAPVMAALAVGGVLLIMLTGWQKRMYADTASDAGDQTGDARDDASDQAKRVSTKSPKDGDAGAQRTFIDIEDLTWRRALIIGLLQCVAMWPGTSRSMMTIVGGMAVGLRPKHAAEFSFLLGLPTLGGACIYKGARNLLGDGPNMFETLGVWPPIIGIIAATISAALAVRWLVGYLTTHGLALFGWYRLALCAVLAVLIAMDVVTF